MNVQTIGTAMVAVLGIVLAVVWGVEHRRDRRWRQFAKRYPRGF